MRQMQTVIDLLQQRLIGKVSGEVLQVQSGKLRDSIKQDIKQDESTILGRVFSDGSVPYFGIQERGGLTRPHDIVPVNAKALRFQVQSLGSEGAKSIKDNTIFAMIVHHPGSKIPAHYMMRDTLRETVALIRQIFSLNERVL